MKLFECRTDISWWNGFDEYLKFARKIYSIETILEIHLTHWSEEIRILQVEVTNIIILPLTSCLFHTLLESFSYVVHLLNPQINLPFNFLIQICFFHDNPTLNINYSE